ncbi:hypothetical protein EDB89DRAFT_1910511 [Lactarius sanguifluus]|nr:hypothetical protein EDB89DRAFT_1910511 [Lactarius sanguifluus]
MYNLTQQNTTPLRQFPLRKLYFHGSISPSAFDIGWDSTAQDQWGLEMSTSDTREYEYSSEISEHILVLDSYSQQRVLVTAVTCRVIAAPLPPSITSSSSFELGLPSCRRSSLIHLDRTTNYDYDNTPQVHRCSFELHELQPSPSSSHDYDTSNTGSNGARRRQRRNHDGPVSINHDHDWAMPVDDDSDHGSIPIDYDNEEMPVDL